MSRVDILAFGIFLFTYAGYQFFFWYVSYSGKWVTRESIIARHRQLWVDLVSADKSNVILAIQSIRNLEMLSTFFSSLVLLMIGGIASFFFQNVDWVKALETGDYLQVFQTHPAAIKMLLSLALLMIALYSFIFSIRISFNMNFTITTAFYSEFSREFYYEQVQRQSRHFISGVRALYHTAIALLWMVDARLMIIASLLSAILFFRFDFLKGTSSLKRSY